MSGSAQPRGAVAPIVIDADAAHPVLAGTLMTRVTRPAERIELLVGVPAQPSVEANRAATVGLLGLVRRMLPGLAATAGPNATISDGKTYRIGGGPYGGYVRVDIPAAPGDTRLRELISRLMGAINQLDFRDPVSSASIVSVGRGYASCTPFQALAVTGAHARIAKLARALGSVTSSNPSLDAMTSRWMRIDGPVGDAALCGRNEHAAQATTLDLPTIASFVVDREFGFAQRIRFDAPRVFGNETVPSLWTGNEERVRLRVRADRPLITVEGRASARRVVTGSLYEYTGPNGRYFRRSLSERHLAEIRDRLRALNVGDRNIVTQLTPSTGKVYVAVRTDGTRSDSAIVGAIAGTDSVERGAVLTASYGNACEDEARMIARAVANAAGRATRIAASLGTSVDTRPVAVQITNGPLPTCQSKTFAPSGVIGRHVSGSLQMPAAFEGRTVLATFRSGTPVLSGAIAAKPATDAASSYAARFGYVPPPIDYLGSSVTGESAREIRLTPQTVQFGLDLGPDNANNFRPIDPAFVTAFTATLGVSEPQYVASFMPGTWNLPSGDREPDTLSLLAVLPYHGAATLSAANAALHLLPPVGYGGLSVLPQHRDCAGAAETLARDAIRGAAAQARAPRGARVVAIDLRGPFTVDGTCRPSSADGGQNFSVREVTIPDVRLAAYARVSYAR